MPAANAMPGGADQRLTSCRCLLYPPQHLVDDTFTLVPVLLVLSGCKIPLFRTVVSHGCDHFIALAITDLTGCGRGFLDSAAGFAGRARLGGFAADCFLLDGFFNALLDCFFGRALCRLIRGFFSGRFLGLGLLGLNYLRRFRMDLNTDDGLLMLTPR